MYEWIKAFHVMAVIAWMASMLYLPRLMVYHAEAQTGSIQSETFKIMERRLLKGIMTPSMIVTWILGLYLAWSGFGFKGGWLHGKILLVFILSGIHGYLVGRVRAFAEDRNLKSARFYRIINEVPAVLMALIVILVVVKPF
ncbi:putative membrane protein [Bosea sp. OK403]|uniref:protoporphyrinogen oxidase HemJ n=1 Tax=Bosea sp. OK403 TaxID=1855286 RepID=UPI0008F12CBD|nr:protoporphyrinogen oxidase HemJ [Bosea sp. OK403]SFJ93616.1 putative membrane protein [Bosea sp. OK403]